MIEFRGRLILMDVEGTVSPLAFVHDVMFPFAHERAADFLAQHGTEAPVLAALEQMAQDVGSGSLARWCPFSVASPEARDWIVAQVHTWMEADVKLTGLKQFQGLVWQKGFHGGELRAQLFPDVAPVWRFWQGAGIGLRIYSSGSVLAQKLFFAHTVDGDLSPLLSGYYDTTTGPKREAASYAAIATDAGLLAQNILFLSDVTEELDAAKEAGMQTALAIRPGNRETRGVQHPAIGSLRDITLVRP